MSTIEIAALAEEHLEPVRVMARAALGIHYADQAEVTPERIERSHARGRQFAAEGGAWVALRGDEVVGVALASVREDLWYLSLLAVSPDLHSGGAGRRLISQALTTAEGVPRRCILASPDPRALRLYASTGHDVHPCLELRGTLDRALVPSGLGVREGDLGTDRGHLEDLARAARGASHGTDLDLMVVAPLRLLVSDGAYAVLGPEGPLLLGARDPDTATSMLWACLAETTAAHLEVEWLTAAAQWAIQLGVAARLTIAPSRSSYCTWGYAPPPAYLPSGAFG